MKKRLISSILVLVLVVSALVGCGQSKQENSTEQTSAEAQATENGDSKEASSTENGDGQEASPEAAGTENTGSNEDSSSVPTGHTATEVNVGYVDVTGGGLNSALSGVAKDQGFFDEEFEKIGVKLNMVPMTGAGPAINEALASGNLDIGELGDVPGVIGKASGVDTQIIAFGGLNNGASLIAGPKTDYKSITDLKGKKIATQRGAFMHRTLSAMLEQAGLTENDIEFVNVNAQEASEMLVTGNVDAIVVGGVTLTRLVEQGYNIVVDYREHPEFTAGGYAIARTKFIEENPDIILAYVKALVRAQNLAKEDKDTMLKQWESTGESKESYEYLYPNHDNYFAIKPAEGEIENSENTLKFLVDNELIPAENTFDIASWVNSSFYDAAYQELGNE